MCVISINSHSFASFTNFSVFFYQSFRIPKTRIPKIKNIQKPRNSKIVKLEFLKLNLEFPRLKLEFLRQKLEFLK